MTLSEHVYCVAIAFKIIERVEQWICIKFCVKLEHTSAKTTQMIEKAAAMGSWWLVASSSQHTRSCITSHAGFFWWNIKSPKWLIPPTAQIWRPATSGFSQNYFWKGRDFRPSVRFRKIQQGNLWWLGELCEVPRCLLWRGLRHHCPGDNVSCIFFNKCLSFS